MIIATDEDARRLREEANAPEGDTTKADQLHKQLADADRVARGSNPCVTVAGKVASRPISWSPPRSHT